MTSTMHQRFLAKYAEPDLHYSFDESPLGYLQNSKKVTIEHISKALADPNAPVRRESLKSPLCTHEHIDIGFMDDESSVRRAAASNPNCTKEHISIALKDESPYVNNAARRNPRYEEYFPN
jgi:HEAT repeat protein